MKDTAKKYGGAVKYDARAPYALGAYFYTQEMARRFYADIAGLLPDKFTVDAERIDTGENLADIWGAGGNGMI